MDDPAARSPIAMVKGATAVFLAAVTALVLGRGLVPNEDRPDEVADLILALTLFGPLVIAHALQLGEAVRRRSIKPIAAVWRGVLAGAGAGVFMGVGLRVGMRAVALGAGQPTTFTVGGSIIVLMIGVVIGGTFGGLFTAARRWLPERFGGPVFGLLIGALFWFPFFEAAAGDLRGVFGELTIAVLTSLLSALWIAYGATLGWLTRRKPAAG